MDYIFRFNEHCCPFGKVNYVNSFVFTPNGGTGASITSIENTIYAGNVTEYILIKGTNVVDEFGELNGDLTVDIQCLDWCKLSFWNNLFPVQVNGFGLGIASTTTVLAVAGGNCLIGAGNRLVQLRGDAVPLGKKIQVQLFGGIGAVRFANVDDRKIIGLDKFVAFEDANFRPEMRALAPNQVEDGDFIVDRDLGQGAHIFNLEAVGIGTTKVTFTDESGCFYLMAFDVKPNLCDPQNGTLPDVDQEPTKNIGVDGNDADYQEKVHNGFCDCDPEHGESQKASTPSTYPIGQEEGFSKLEDLYDQDDFVHGTRHVDLEEMENLGGGGDFPVKPGKIWKLQVGEEIEVKIPNIGGKRKVDWEITTLQWKDGGAGGAYGEGWDNSSFGPAFSQFASPEDAIVKAQVRGKGDKSKVKVSCLAPTNNLPTTLHLYPKDKDITALGGPIPKKSKEVSVTNDPANAIASYKSKSTGNTSYLKAEEGDGISMTQPDFFVGVECTCPEIDVKITDLKSIYSAGDEIEMEAVPAGDGNLAILPKKARMFVTKEGIISEGNLEWANPLLPQDQANTQPKEFKFKFATIKPNGTLVWSTLQIFYTNASKDVTPLNKHDPAEKAFPDQVMKEVEFFKEIDGNTKTFLKHTPAEDCFECFQEQGNTIQPRGTWCINNATVIAKFPKKLPAIKTNSGQARALRDEKTLILPSIDLDMGDMVLKVKKLKKRSSFNIQGPNGSLGIRG